MGVNTTTILIQPGAPGRWSDLSAALFDGRFLYLVPYGSGSGNGYSVTRYDTTLPISSVSSYTTFALRTCTLMVEGFAGLPMTGAISISVPYAFTFATQYDTTQNFNASGSYTTFDLSLVGGSGGYNGALFDGRYVYFAPRQTSIVSCYIRRFNYRGKQLYEL